MMRNVLVTGGAGFIGSAVCRHLVGAGVNVLNVDVLTYAGNLASLSTIDNAPNYRFARIDICDRRAIAEAFETFRPDHVIHLAAESHVDRSITGSDAFIQTNIIGTFSMLEAARAYWLGLPLGKARRVPLPACVDRRGLWLARRRGPVRRDDALRSELALFRVEGRVRSPRLGLGAHLRLPGRHLELLQQLRPLSFPRKADPARHSQRHPREAAAGLRRGSERARLALCRGPCARARSHRQPRPHRREVQRRRPQRAAQHRRRAPHLRDPRPSAPDGSPVRARSSPSSPTGPGTISATRSTPPSSSANSAGGRSRPSRAASRRRSAGISTTNGGGVRCARRSTRASVSACCRPAEAKSANTPAGGSAAAAIGD